MTGTTEEEASKASSQLEGFHTEEKDDSPEGRAAEKAALIELGTLKMHDMPAGPEGPLGCPTPRDSCLLLQEADGGK